MLKRSFLFLILFIHTYSILFSQNLDSLKLVANKVNLDTSNANALNSLGLYYFNEGNYSEAISFCNKAFNISQKIGFKKGLIKSLINIGVIYTDKGNYPEGQKKLLQSLRLAEELNTEKLKAIIYNELGIINYNTKNYNQAIDYYSLAIKINESLKDDRNTISCYLGLGDIFDAKGDFSKALQYYIKAEHKAELISDNDNLAIAYNNIGTLFQNQNKFDKALNYCLKSVEIHKQLGNTENEAISYLNIATIYKDLKKYELAEIYLNKGYDISKELGGTEILQETYKIRYELDSIKGDYKSVFGNFKLYRLYRDSIENADVAKKIVQEQMQYDFDKKQAIEKAEQEKKDALEAQEKKRQRLLMLLIIIAAVGAGIVALLIFRNLQINKKKNKIIELQKAEVEQKNVEIEHKQKEILDSITYAKRIQSSILPPLEEVNSMLPNSFILFKPKDIVSGDFYWFSEKNGYTYIAAADCTGHGVPGAFMSMLNAEKLTEALESTNTPGHILSLVNKGLKKALRQSDKEGASRDGMDIALLRFNSGLKNLIYAGANRPLWIIKKNSELVEEIKATKTAIGGLTDDNQLFIEHSLELQAEDCIYIFSDGYADQFGKNDKKLMTKKFKEVLLSIQHLNMSEQKKHLNDYIEDWKVGNEQTDDILVIGIKI